MSLRAFAAGPDRLFLGLQQQAGRFGLSLAQDAIEALKTDERFHIIDLRSIAVQGLVAPEHLPPLAEAKALLHWHARHRFCSNCGQPTNVVGGRLAARLSELPGAAFSAHRSGRDHARGARRRLPARAASPVSRRACGRASRALSSRAKASRKRCAARRWKKPEFVCGRVRYFASQPWPFPSSLMIGCHAEALSDEIVVDRDELEDARWFSRDETAAMLMRTHPDGLGTPPPVAIAHHIIRAWVEKGDDVFA